MLGSPEKVYSDMVKYLDVKQVAMRDVAWVTDPWKLREEMLQNCNQNCGLSQSEIEKIDCTDNWLKLLSEEERTNYQGYLKRLGMEDQQPGDRLVRGVAVGQDHGEFPMMGNENQLPSFTKESTKRIMLTHLDRWLTAEEKLALTGFPVHQEGLTNIFYLIVECAELCTHMFETKCTYIFPSPSLVLDP